MTRRGPKAQSGKREANGRLSRRKADIMDRVSSTMEKEEREILRPGIEARVRVHGVAPEVSRDQRAGSFIGRLCMSGEITQRQYEAALIYLEDRRNYLMAIRAPRDPSGVDLNRVQGNSTGQENVSFARRSFARWQEVSTCVQARENELRGVGAMIRAFDTCMVRDIDAHHLVGWLREGLNALAKHYEGQDKRSGAKAA